MVAKQMVAGLADLLYNRPSLMMQYSKDMFAILVQDHHQHMRLSVTQMIIQLVMSGVLRFKEGIGHLVYLLVDTDAQVRSLFRSIPGPAWCFRLHPPQHSLILQLA